MFGLSGEHLLILAAVLLIFGPRKLPELGGSIGKALRNFKEGLNSPPRSVNETQTQITPAAQATPAITASTTKPESLNDVSKINEKAAPTAEV